jgi:hypothetical protein
MRHLIISAEPYGSMRFSYGTCMPDESLWATILPNLNSLLIVTKLSIGARKYWDALTLEEDIAQWMMWVRPYLQCFGKHIPDTLSAIVDDEGMSATTEFVEHYLPGCQLQPSALGDHVLKRKRHSFGSESLESE